jgi:hypothetical protein
LDELCKINRYFNNFESNAELINSLKRSFNEKQIKIIINDNKCILSILNPIKQQNFELNIGFKPKDLNSQITSLIEIIKQDRKRIEILEEKVNKFEKLFDEIKKEKEQKEKEPKKKNKIFLKKVIF